MVFLQLRKTHVKEVLALLPMTQMVEVVVVVPPRDWMEITVLQDLVRPQ